MGLFARKEPNPPHIVYQGYWVPTGDLFRSPLWDVCAALAWSYYLDFGRGGLLMPHEPAGRFDYLPASRPSLQADRVLWAQRLKEDLRRYTPEREFVLVFAIAKDEHAYRAGRLEDFERVLWTPPGFSTPPAAYQRFYDQRAQRLQDEQRQRDAFDSTAD